MGLTRPTAAQINTVITTISDPITVLNQGATLANIDVGFIINRNGGALANTAIFWNESANTFATAFTAASGDADCIWLPQMAKPERRKSEDPKNTYLGAKLSDWLHGTGCIGKYGLGAGGGHRDG